MNTGHARPPLGGFEGRLEAELVRVVGERAVAPARTEVVPPDRKSVV